MGGDTRQPAPQLVSLLDLRKNWIHYIFYFPFAFFSVAKQAQKHITFIISSTPANKQK